ncbi:MAG TPA: hypothetical protein ENO14_00150 [Chromatiales bacterium]|nr:hypothetical protein [Chromatiales bacterium]
MIAPDEIGAFCPVLPPAHFNAMRRELDLVKDDDGLLYHQCYECGDFFPFDTQFWSLANRAKRGIDRACRACRKEKKASGDSSANANDRRRR